MIFQHSHPKIDDDDDDAGVTTGAVHQRVVLPRNKWREANLMLLCS